MPVKTEEEYPTNKVWGIKREDYISGCPWVGLMRGKWPDAPRRAACSECREWVWVILKVGRSPQASLFPLAPVNHRLP